jgi:hypothetical protein
VVSGWKCIAGIITVTFDNGPAYVVAYGTIREGTQGVCGDTNNGFSFLWNWNRLGDGMHVVRVFDNGAQFGIATVHVQTLGAEFRTGLNSTLSVLNFPGTGQSTLLVWQQSQQNFASAGVTTAGSVSLNTLIGHWLFAYTILVNFANTYHLNYIDTSTGTPLFFGTDEFGDLIAAARTQDLTTEPFPFAFALLDPGSTLCRFFVFNQLDTNTLEGVYLQLDVTSTGECSSSSSGNVYQRIGARLTAALSLSASAEARGTQEEREAQQNAQVQAQGIGEAPWSTSALRDIIMGLQRAY